MDEVEEDAVGNSAPITRVLVVAEELGDLLAALQQSYPTLCFELVQEWSLARTVVSQVDAWIVDLGLGPLKALAWMRDVARLAPGIVLDRSASDALALRAFRAGARAVHASAEDCVAALGEMLHAETLRTSHSEKRDILKASEIRAFIETFHVAIWVVNEEGVIEFANPAAADLAAMEVRELEGLPVSHFFRSQDPVPVLQCIEHGVEYQNHESWLVREDASDLQVSLSCTPCDFGAENRGAIALLQDLTDAKQLQQQQLQVEKLESIGQLAAGIAHEINNPMGFIHANLCQLTEYIGDLKRVWAAFDALRHQAKVERLDPEALRAAASECSRIIEEVDAAFLLDDFSKAIEESLEGAERVRSIVKDLRAFSFQDTTERAVVDINKVLDSTANIVWTMMRNPVKLVKEYGELPSVSTLPVPLKQVLMNLLINAYQSIEERALLDAEFRGEIRLRTEMKEKGVLISVIDNGVGIASEILPKIFDPFFTTKQASSAIGLGLTTSYNLLEKQGGRINVESVSGEGALVSVWLPLEAPR